MTYQTPRRRQAFPHKQASEPRVVDAPAQPGVMPHRYRVVTTACGKEEPMTLVTLRDEQVRCEGCKEAIAATPSCPVCRDTGIIQCPETNPEDGTYEQACPEKVHDGQQRCPACGATTGTLLCDGCKFDTCRACGYPCACGEDGEYDDEEVF